MKKLFSILIAFATFAYSSVGFSSETIKNVTIVNHYPYPILFRVNDQLHVVPQLKAVFILQPNQTVQSTVVGPAENEAYLSTDSSGPIHAYDYLGIDAAYVHGYIASGGLAYSYDNKLNTTIIFCTTADYDSRGHC